ncbi:protein tramtrack, alpha isoform-like [Sabethes cyaneus]|uniref:protein tramtrack, alpha isoform-like n=1 Tax=Sabethes cyaneus TaxID=53552 RepID=UPI00237E8E64|nr:protein tramtrack, alpha isoform-like [Sabethes cyaneus]
MDSNLFCIRWDNHQRTIISMFSTLLENETLVDCTLAAEGKFLKAHKIVLSACSPYFAELLSQQYDKHPIFILKDLKFEELQAILNYMYCGEVNVPQGRLVAFLKTAVSLQVRGLADKLNTSSNVSNQQPKPTHSETTETNVNGIVVKQEWPPEDNYTPPESLPISSRRKRKAKLQKLRRSQQHDEKKAHDANQNGSEETELDGIDAIPPAKRQQSLASNFTDNESISKPELLIEPKNGSEETKLDGTDIPLAKHQQSLASNFTENESISKPELLIEPKYGSEETELYGIDIPLAIRQQSMASNFTDNESISKPELLIEPKNGSEETELDGTDIPPAKRQQSLASNFTDNESISKPELLIEPKNGSEETELDGIEIPLAKRQQSLASNFTENESISKPELLIEPKNESEETELYGIEIPLAKRQQSLASNFTENESISKPELLIEPKNESEETELYGIDIPLAKHQQSMAFNFTDNESISKPELLIEPKTEIMDSQGDEGGELLIFDMDDLEDSPEQLECSCQSVGKSPVTVAVADQSVGRQRRRGSNETLDFKTVTMDDGVVRYLCPQCGVKYKRVSALRTHMKECGKGAQCPLCSKIVTQRRNLAKHMERHKREGLVRVQNLLNYCELNFPS